MNIISAAFVIFLTVTAAAYFILPARFRRAVLLAASLGFYCFSGAAGLIFLAVTALSAFFCALAIASLKASGKNDRAKVRKKKKTLLILCLTLNFGMLAAFKYLPGGGFFGIFMPLGISFYTFGTMGYLCDVYWGKVKPEKSFFDFLLFVSFFPKIIQGPITSYSEHKKEMEKCLPFEGDRFVSGVIRMVWGFFKKMAVANVLALSTDLLFENFRAYSGPAVFLGTVLYCIRTYADFSGYMDIMCGYCEILGIGLTENFRRPYFSRSVAEYWRRWHISLGTWFKSYVYYPIALAKWNQKLGRRVKNLSAAAGTNLPATLALIAVWLLTGVWHGSGLQYAAWGLVNGAVIIFSLWADPLYARLKKALGMKEGAFLTVFSTVRTFILMCFIKVLPDVGTLRDGLSLWKRIFTGGSGPLLPYVGDKTAFAGAMVGAALMLAVSIFGEKGRDIRGALVRRPAAAALLCALLSVAMIYFGLPASGKVLGFMYAQF